MSMTSPSPPVLAGNRDSARYHLLVRVIHAAMAVLFVFMWLSGYAMRHLMADDSALQETVYDLHKTGGVSLVVLLFLRLGARLLTETPALPGALSPAERMAARAGHVALYALMGATLLTGWALTDFGGHGVVWFGVPMPQVFPIRESLLGIGLDPLASDLHAIGAYALLALVAVHLLAVIKHRWDGHDLLPRIDVRR